MLSDAAWQSIHPFLKDEKSAKRLCLREPFREAPNVDCAPVPFGTHLDNQRRRDLAVATESLRILECQSIDVSADGVMPGSLKNSMTISMRQVIPQQSGMDSNDCARTLERPGWLEGKRWSAIEALGRSKSGYYLQFTPAVVKDAAIAFAFTLTARARP